MLGDMCIFFHMLASCSALPVFFWTATTDATIRCSYHHGGWVGTVMLGYVPCHNPVQLVSWGMGGNCHVGFCSIPQSGPANIMGKGW